MQDTAQLVRCCQEGNLEAFSGLFRRYEKRVFELNLAILQNREEAKDALQDTFLQVFQYIDGYKAESAFETWITAIAVNCCRQRLRRRKIRQIFSLEYLTPRWLLHISPQNSPVAELDAKQRRQSLWEMVSGLDDRLRIPLILHYQHEFSCAEIADMLGLKLGSVYQQLHQGRERLRQQVAQQAHEQTAVLKRIG